ncbi:sulphite efflux pump protein [Coprinopsis cinerea okayama7|uniref:Sulphite efflux pump protein n=1 Tax=Coprinopsis cinerea (strain Okayama-7 / 130 / ATCC MYA-4618 / FGSC 9003) TaxID=240176 RepID=D6RLK8_COPC7|nr:sulphite efflux pump protein [Coprinopsis cinerea okayama7\|eukprot:XP_002911614.1 sulphite efflux pump protein [Coprinopsis cinerea okayama7\
MLASRHPWIERATNLAGLLTRIANPVLFAVIMGTGAVSILFEVFPYGRGSRGMMIVSLAFFFLNLILCCIFFSFSVAKYVVYPDRWSALIRNPITSLYLGCFPMGLTTLINVGVDVINIYFAFGGRTFLYTLWGFWWVVVAISVVCCWVGVHMMFIKQNPPFNKMTAMWLLPVVTLIVAASSGGVLAQALQTYSHYHALLTVVFSIFIVTVGLTLAFMILTIYLARLIIHGLPPGVTVLSVFLPLGPTGQSGFAFYLIGANFRTLVPYEHAGKSVLLSSPMVGEFLYTMCVSAAFLLWSLATMWMLYALLALHATVLRNPVGFRMSFWGLVFPNGVYANLTIALSVAFDSTGLRIYGAAYAIVVICVWLSIAVRSLIAFKRLANEACLPVMESKAAMSPEQNMNARRLQENSFHGPYHNS